MKQIATDRVDSFESWRNFHRASYGDYVWIQLNYNPENADIISLVFEEKANKINSNIPSELLSKNAKIINFFDPKSKFYIHNIESLKNVLNLSLLNEITNLNYPSSYWDYRLKTRPQNCLTADIDALEITHSGFVAIEAAQLFDTSNIDNAIPHIFRTFNFRKNKVNPNQYYAQFKYAKTINSEAFILFHKINGTILDEKSPVFLLKNDEMFYRLLNFILRLGRTDESEVIKKCSPFLKNSLVQFQNIHEAYRYIKSI